MIGYGLVSTLHIKGICQAVCDVLGGDEHVVRLMCETAAAETGYGTIPDKTRHGAGRGLFQCDKIAFDDVLARTRPQRVKALEQAFDFDLLRVEWDDLNYSPLLAAVVCRLHYLLIPEPVPQTLKGRAEYWKKYYNTVAGKGSPADYIFRVQKWERFL